MHKVKPREENMFQSCKNANSERSATPEVGFKNAAEDLHRKAHVPTIGGCDIAEL